MVRKDSPIISAYEASKRLNVPATKIRKHIDCGVGIFKDFGIAITHPSGTKSYEIYAYKVEEFLEKNKKGGF